MPITYQTPTEPWGSSSKACELVQLGGGGPLGLCFLYPCPHISPPTTLGTGHHRYWFTFEFQEGENPILFFISPHGSDTECARRMRAEGMNVDWVQLPPVALLSLCDL